MELSTEEIKTLLCALCYSKASIAAQLAANAEYSHTEMGRSKANKYYEQEEFYLNFAAKIEKTGLNGLSRDEVQKLLALYKSPHVVDIAINLLLDGDGFDEVLARFKSKTEPELTEIYGKQRKILHSYVKALKVMDTHAGTDEQQDIADI